MTELAAPLIHAPGIYFGLNESEYHADTALGSTAIKAIAVDAYEFQFDRLFGEDRDADFFNFGRGVHARIMESADAFNSKFCQAMPPGFIPENALDTTADLKRFLSEHGVKGTSSKLKGDLIKACLEIDPNVAIVQVIKERWDALNEGKTKLNAKRWAQVELAAQWAQRDPLLSAVMENGTFTDGAPEVSIFYEDRGVRLKARFDRLLRHAIIDLKTFAPMFDDEMADAALKTVKRMRYPVQAAAYLRAWHKARELFAQGKVFGDEPFPGFLTECFARLEPKWIWILIKSKGAPQPLVIDWQAKFAMGRAADDVEHAINEYIRLRDEFGEDKEWVPARPAQTWDDTSVPSWF